jgi:hypothetical protein
MKALGISQTCGENQNEGRTFFVEAGSFSDIRDCAIAAKSYLTLATMYAQGLGVPRDLTVAKRYACLDGGPEGKSPA